MQKNYNTLTSKSQRISVNNLTTILLKLYVMIGGRKMLFRQAISRRIFELCELYKYTPNKLAEMSGIPPTTLQDMVSEKVANPSSFVIYKICKTLKIEIKDFYNSELFKLDNLDD